MHLDPLVIEHKEQRREIVTLGLNYPVKHLPSISVDIRKDLPDVDFVVESGEVDRVGACIKNRVHTVVFDSLCIVRMLLKSAIGKDIPRIRAADTDTLVEL